MNNKTLYSYTRGFSTPTRASFNQFCNFDRFAPKLEAMQTISDTGQFTLASSLNADLSLVHTSEISTSTNARHAHAQNQSSTNQTISARTYTWHLCLCLSHQCEPGFTVTEAQNVVLRF